MTALCGGGASHAKPGAAALAIYTAGGLALVAERSGWRWLLPLIPALGTVQLATDTLCAGDPPGYVALTPADVLAFFSLDPTPAKTLAVQKVAQNIHTMAWWDLCECVAGPQPAEPAPPAPPANAPTVIAPPPPLATACQNTTLYFGGMPSSGTATEGHKAITATGVTLLQIVFSNALISGSPGASAQWHVFFSNLPAGTTYPEVVYTQAVNAALTVTLAVPVGATHVDVALGPSGVAATQSCGAVGHFYCNGQVPGAPACACGGTDPTTLAVLAQILELVTLIQRQDVAFAYTPRAIWAGLTGFGEITVQGLVGYKVELTVVPEYLGHLIGDPPRIFDAGWTAVGTSDGWGTATEITANPKIVFPDEMGLVTRIGYSFAPNIVATITELVREA